MKKIAVSACLLGQNVRYNGKSKSSPQIINQLAKLFTLVSVCPECMAGLSVPRPPINLIKNKQSIRAVLVDAPYTDLTSALTLQANKWLLENKQISGLLLKARSPSCAINTAPVNNTNRINNELSHGIFTSLVLKSRPDLPVIDEELIRHQAYFEKFIAKVASYKL